MRQNHLMLRAAVLVITALTILADLSLAAESGGLSVVGGFPLCSSLRTERQQRLVGKAEPASSTCIDAYLKRCENAKARLPLQAGRNNVDCAGTLKVDDLKPVCTVAQVRPPFKDPQDSSKLIHIMKFPCDCLGKGVTRKFVDPNNPNKTIMLFQIRANLKIASETFNAGGIECRLKP